MTEWDFDTHRFDREDDDEEEIGAELPVKGHKAKERTA